MGAWRRDPATRRERKRARRRAPGRTDDTGATSLGGRRPRVGGGPGVRAERRPYFTQ